MAEHGRRGCQEPGATLKQLDGDIPLGSGGSGSPRSCLCGTGPEVELGQITKEPSSPGPSQPAGRDVSAYLSRFLN
jgi:hypothetical protein